MTLMDLSKYRQNFVKDTEQDMQEIASMKQTQMIPEGTHEVVVCGIHEKDGVKFKINDKLGGTLGFSLIVKNAMKQEQMIYICIPLVQSFIQAKNSEDRGTKFLFVRVVKNLQVMGINPIALRESIITTNGASAELLIGTQFVVNNYWEPKSIHFEYDSIAKANFFVTSMGQRFESGEMALPYHVDLKKPINERFKEFIAIAHENGYMFSSQMLTSIDTHPTANNDSINESLQKSSQPKEQKKSIIVNKTIPAAFPVQVKKPIVPPDTELDIEF